MSLTSTQAHTLLGKLAELVGVDERTLLSALVEANEQGSADAHEGEAPDFVEQALAERAHASDADEQAPDPTLPVKLLNVGEYAWARTRVGFTRSNLEVPKNSIVTTYTDAEGEQRYRVWADGKYRHMNPSWALARKDGDKGAYVNVKRISSPSRQLDREARASARVAKDKAIHEYVIAHEAITLPKGTQVLKAAANGNWIVRVNDTRTHIVSGKIVKNGKLTQDVRIDGTHFDAKTRRHVKKHNAGECTCKGAWLCPAAQKLGQNDVTVGAVTYTAGEFVAKFDISGASETLRARVNAQAWGLDS